MKNPQSPERPSTPVVASPSPLPVSEILRGRNVFILGSTGFVGKVLLGMLLERFPQIGRAYVMVRRGSGTDAESRFWKSVVTSPVFNPLRDKHGGAEGLATFLKQKVVVVDGDITEPNLGLSEEAAQRVAQDIDVLINSSGRVTFNPPLESALRTNVEGTKNVIAFAKRMKRPALIHTSTCFVAGNRSGEVWENEELDGYFPRRGELTGTKFSVEQEMADNALGAARIRQLADDAQVLAKFRQDARARLRDENRDPDDEGALKLAVARARKEWIREEMTQQGVERAAKWGWPNIYTYTKSMGDQLVARETGIFRSIVRPAIVESAVAYPFPGWNEGFTTSAPLVYLALKGQNVLPVSNKLILDVVPVDHVCAAMLMAAAQAMVEQPPLVFQLSSGDLNPLHMDRVVTLTGLYKRQRFQTKESGNKFLNELVARMEFRPVSEERYDKLSIPMINRVAKRASETLEKIRPKWGAGRFSEVVDRFIKGAGELERVTAEAAKNIELFRPFIFENAYILRADHARALFDRLPPEDQKLLVWGPQHLDWHDYWMNIHFPGLQRWVLPELDETYASKPKQVYSYHDLLELFDTTTKLHATRTAVRIERGKRDEIYSYADLQELASRVGVFLLGQEVPVGARVLIVAKNAPEWSMAFFGILKAHGTAVPLAHESNVAEIVNIARASGAAGILIGDDVLDKRAGLAKALAEAGLAAKVWPFTQAFELPDLAIEKERLGRLARKHNPDTLASLIFTSGTTGKPKGVMLTHRNFTFMVSELSKVFEFGVNDGMLSVLPLSHTFEFATGMLVPLAHGAQITYLSELTGDAIGSALKKGRVTAIVGVPALWDLMRRRLMQRFSEKAPILETFLKGLMAANYELRTRTKIDLGVLVFLPIHEGFGGRIRYLISGGSALPPDVLKAFHGLGFNFFEGYGLTETAPVLTVTSPKDNPIVGSVGKPLPGIEVKLSEPDPVTGVGEVVARGRNVMAGYWEDEAATAAVVKDGWFHTGDLGRIDDAGNLYIVGRSKEIIVDTNGKNVYPDEIEDLYRDSPYIKDLSVVGLPDGTGEQVACAVVANYEHDAMLSRAEVQSRIDEHFRKLSADLPFWKRVKVMQIWPGEDLPRTAKRSVKRREVVAELQSLRKKAEESTGALVAAVRSDESAVAWLLDTVATVSGRRRADVMLGSRFDQLGFDSLMYAELSSAMEAAGVNVPEELDVTSLGTVAELHEILVRGHLVSSRTRAATTGAPDDDAELNVPAALSRAGKRGLSLAQRLFYERVLDTDVKGASHVPQHTNFIVAANHASHLDMGVIKVALGDAGKDLTSLAAADYFFRNKYRRAFFKHFTNLVPMERSGSIRKSMDLAERVLRGGRNMVVFPEGTRSLSGELADFLPSLGYLALRADVGILPAYISGAYESLPKGAAVPRARELGVAFGPFLSSEWLGALTTSLPAQDGWRLVAAYVQRVVENLRDGVTVTLDAEAARAAWNGETQTLGVLASRVSPPGAKRRFLRSVS
ncbi:MAG: putative long-chain-fatty-acid CoA ligase [Myxococcales bacterium]|nr:putative long-chain-fatty-acid CoA ligase [Myxococcales bacterium]